VLYLIVVKGTSSELKGGNRMEKNVKITNPVLDPENYVQTRTPDRAELANLIRKAKGINRTMADFANECGENPSKFSRIANGKITQPLALDTLAKIAIHADPESQVHLGSLTIANGMVTKDFLERKEKRREGSASKDEARFDMENRMKNIITNAILERGLAIAYQKRIHVNEGVPAIASGCGRGNLLIRIPGYEPLYWKYKTMTYIGVRRGVVGEPLPEGIDFECEADFMFHDEAEYFLKTLIEPERFEKVKLTYVFPDREIYEAFYRKVSCVKANAWISLVLVDLNANKVIEETILERRDGKTTTSIFELPILGDDDTGEFSGEEVLKSFYTSENGF